MKGVRGPAAKGGAGNPPNNPREAQSALRFARWRGDCEMTSWEEGVQIA